MIEDFELDRIRIVLVRTFQSGNIGSTARSMKTMGLSELYLVEPREFPSSEASKMAAGAKDMLDGVTVVESLKEAIADCTVIIASTTRSRNYDLPELNPEQAAQLLVTSSAKSPVALVFGPERMGLHNLDIKYAKYRSTIPANPNYNSLNLAAAVQTFSYEIFKAALALKAIPSVNPAQKTRELPSSTDIEHLHQHLESVLKEIAFLRPHQGETLERIRNLIARGEPDVRDTNILRGILSAVEKTIGNR